MAFDGLRNLEWLAHNEARAYPLVVSADGVSTDEQFELPNAVILSVYLFLPWDRDIDPSQFFLSQIRNLGETFGVTIAYKPPSSSALVIATVEFPRNETGKPSVREWVPEEDWLDIAGSVTIGNLHTLSGLPIGVFDFDFEHTQLEVDCIRPAARMISGIQVDNGDEVFTPVSGLINLRAGENIRLRVEEVDGVNDIWIDAVNTDELHSDCECGDALSEPIRTINLIRGDVNGNIDLLGAKCLEIETGQAALSLSNPCSEPCCGCEEAEALQEAIQIFGPQLAALAGFAPRLAGQMDRIEFIVSMTDIGSACDEISNGSLTTTSSPSTTTTTTEAPTTTGS